MTRPSSPLTMLLSRHTRRREFITLIGGAAYCALSATALLLACLVVSSHTAHSQQVTRGAPGWRGPAETIKTYRPRYGKPVDSGTGQSD
jgi:hypothetical protein